MSTNLDGCHQNVQTQAAFVKENHLRYCNVDDSISQTQPVSEHSGDSVTLWP